MRCMSKFACIAQCLAAPMLHRAGLLTADDYAYLIEEGFDLPAIDSNSNYVPINSPSLSYTISSLAEPILGEEPLEVGGGFDAAVRASDHYNEWREQLRGVCQETLRKYVEQVYIKDNFIKHNGETNVGPLIDASALELEGIFSSSGQLRRSYLHVSDLIYRCNKELYHFFYLMIAFGNCSRAISATFRNLQDKNRNDFDAATLKKINGLRFELNCQGKGLGLEKSFGGGISDAVLGTYGAVNATESAYINSFRDYCNNALAYARKLFGRISREGVVQGAFGIGDKVKRVDEDPFKYLHLVYPELDYEAWGIYWRTAHNQITNEVKALQKHINEVAYCMNVDEVSNCRSSCRKLVLELFNNFDDAMANHQKAGYFDYIAFTSKLIPKIIPTEIEKTTENTLDQILGEKYQKTRIDVDAIIREIDAKRTNIAAESAGESENKGKSPDEAASVGEPEAKRKKSSEATFSGEPEQNEE
ncbi:hypothetical protein PAPHI01_1802 [Pancytospora philotis]|nr:hypothetical protein PAPHI01_1802 [Pancytospora philotis]